ncbi:alpha/beta hydrolase [Anaerocolumna sp. MB42-C2]|uniref:alpha/beta hydrolase n=1 Tax=Anaerocolumna sp. MB42-C2 TaxID=3070997 RepID=UPI0027E1DA9C|nr:alpha/beta hydrolase family protein [Anaerocolumna sp. MB42-C2]WMJ90128.1 alpha/beta hydrolase family protein [Anaerocolumna sp. MB42-C2]
MAFIQMDYYSKALTRSTDVAVILPENNTENGLYPVLWLLHGAMGNYGDWWRFTSVELYAEQYGIAVVMPSADNSFYANISTGRYFDFVANELFYDLAGMFPFDTARKKNIVGGLSMGGHGAYKFGLTKPEQYGGVGIFSAGNFIDLGDPPAGILAELNMRIFGTTHVKDLEGSEHDILNLARKAAERKGELPALFVCCGTEDRAFDSAKTTYNYLTELGFQGEWHQDTGKHDMYFWGKMLPAMMEWCKRTVES